MNAAALITDWDIPWLVTTLLIVSSAVYVRGWLRIRRTRPRQFPGWRVGCFLAGMAAIFVALASPLDTLDDKLLLIHMVQHFFLMSIAPPLIIFGAPIVPMLRGLPRWLIRKPLRPLFSTGFLPKIGSFVTQPKVAWLLMNLSYISWHIPAAYELTLRSENIHNCEHACFLFSNLIFWWPVIAPWPFRQGGGRKVNNTLGGEAHRWVLIPYLMLADVVNTIISATLCFSGKIIYPSYGVNSGFLGLTPMSDQAAAGAFMWVMGSMMYLIPGMIITMRLLSPNRQRMRMAAAAR